MSVIEIALGEGAPDRINRIFDDVYAERERQETIGAEKRADGEQWSSCADPDMAGGDDRRFTVLGEEIGEIARAVLEGTPNLRDELVQAAAVCVAWVESIDEGRQP